LAAERSRGTKSLDLFVIENDDQGNLLEVYSNTNWIVRRFIYGLILRKAGEYIFPLIQVNFDGFLLPAPRENHFAYPLWRFRDSSRE